MQPRHNDHYRRRAGLLRRNIRGVQPALRKRTCYASHFALTAAQPGVLALEGWRHGLATLPPPRCHHQPLVVKDKDERPPRGPPGGTQLQLCGAGVLLGGRNQVRGTVERKFLSVISFEWVFAVPLLYCTEDISFLCLSYLLFCVLWLSCSGFVVGSFAKWLARKTAVMKTRLKSGHFCLLFLVVIMCSSPALNDILKRPWHDKTFCAENAVKPQTMQPTYNSQVPPERILVSL